MSGFPAPAARIQMNPVAVAGLGAATGVPRVKNMETVPPSGTQCHVSITDRSTRAAVAAVGTQLTIPVRGKVTLGFLSVPQYEENAGGFIAGDVRGAVVVVTLVMSGCAGTPGEPQAAPAGEGHNSVDVMFAQMMIPHHDDAIAMGRYLEQGMAWTRRSMFWPGTSSRPRRERTSR